MNEAEQIVVTGFVSASPAQIFALLADPHRHQDLDGSGMLRGLVEGSTLRGVGDHFIMDMNNHVLGDYQVRIHLTEFEPDRRIGWSGALHPEDSHVDKLGDIKAGGHTFVWELTPDPAGGTAITLTYDWSTLYDQRMKPMMPFLTPDQLRTSIERVGELTR
ncbi:MAG: SRPBCC domain-containing protein [Sporichthyaceae bacterium]